MHADLHCHSTFSDGTLTPTQLAQRAKARGVDLWALTDHDEIAGVHEARSAALALGMDFVTGVEISVSFGERSVHIVGLGCDIACAALQTGLSSIRDSRGPRAQAMGQQLEQAGIAGAYEGALRYAGNPALIARTHFARFLVDQGYCRDTYDVFKHYLVEGKPGFVPQRWASLREAIGWIQHANGVAVLAHPARYDLTPVQTYALFQTFKDCGGQAVEVVCGSHQPHEYATYADWAREFGMHASRGSDFHSPEESKVDLGGLPLDRHALPSVWELLTNRIDRAAA